MIARPFRGEPATVNDPRVTAAVLAAPWVGGNDDGTDDFAFGDGNEGLAGKTVTQDDTNNRAEFDANDVTWTGINAGTAAACVVYKDTGNNATSPLIAYIDSGGFPVTTNGGDLTITWNSQGIVQIS